MFRPRVIPVLLLKGKGLVKTVKFSNEKYIGDPINAVRIYNDLEADELVFLDISATPEKRTISLDLVKEIGEEAYMPFSVGGGINNLEDIRKLLKIGAEKVILNSSIIKNPELLKNAALEFGNQSIVASIDVKSNLFGKQNVYTHCGKSKINFSVIDYAKKIEELGAGEIMITSIDKEGTMSGYDIQLIKKISEAVSIPVIANGGASDLLDLKTAFNQGKASAMAAGSLFVYHGPRKAVLINYPSKIELNEIYQ
jgi:cyclase